MSGAGVGCIAAAAVKWVLSGIMDMRDEMRAFAVTFPGDSFPLV